MPIIVHSNPGRVTGLWGSAMIRLRDGKLHPLKVGDEINKGDLLLTSQDGIVELHAQARSRALPFKLTRSLT